MILKDKLIVVSCTICGARFEAHKDCQLVKEGRTCCERDSTLRGPAWWLIYKKAFSPEEAGASDIKTWRKAEQECKDFNTMLHSQRTEHRQRERKEIRNERKR